MISRRARHPRPVTPDVRLLQAGTMSQIDTARRLPDDAAKRTARLEMLALPAVPLMQTGFLRRPARTSAFDLAYQRELMAFGVGFDQRAYAVWADAVDPRRQLVTIHADGEHEPDSFLITDGVPASYVQPLTNGRTLVVSARSRASGNADVYDNADGRLLHRAHLGDAIGQQIGTTEGGDVWVGYFDEALGNDVSGVELFDSSLRRLRADRHPAALLIDDCYTLNVVGEQAYICAYSDFHLRVVSRNGMHDHGSSPHRGPGRLLIQGDEAIFIGGYGPYFDLVTCMRIRHDHLEPVGPQRRLVMPDGLDLPRGRWAYRGACLHLIYNTGWYRIDFDALKAGH